VKINVLPQSIANMIAAGEVVERPSSVVKELAENSIDAGAKSVTIEIKKGGMSYIRITDDGCGIAPGEVVTAFKRHATSKIKTKDDLNSIYTLGFRGEALASIAAVARVDIFTKTKDDDFGYTVSIEGGEVLEEGEAGCPNGTTITVRDLFFNTPARMKFLKSDATETSYVTDAVHKLILSHPEVAVKLIVNGKTTVSSVGDGNTLSAIRSVFGRDYINHLSEISYEEDGIKIKGFIGTSALARKDSRQQVFFINGRYIKSKIISAALAEANQNVMMVGRFPVAVISVEVMGSFVDVNVHPTKTEVRFSDDKKVYNAVYWAVKNALNEKKYVPEFNITSKKENEDLLSVRKQIAKEKNKAYQADINLLKDTYIKDLKDENKKDLSFAQNDDIKDKALSDAIKESIDKNTFFKKEDIIKFNEPSAKYDFGQKEIILKDEKAKNTLEEEKSTQIPMAEKILEENLPKPHFAPKANTDFSVIGQIFNTYIIVQKDNEMLIIDQHAAHERIYFENLLEEYRAKDSLKGQLMMFPVTVDFDPVSFNIAANNLDIFASLGFECEEFGDKSIIVRTCPSAMTDSDIKDTIIDITHLIKKGTSDIKKTLMEDALHTMACKRAVKGNTLLTKREAELLVEKVLEFETINTCPHGRPIMISMSKYELEKNFKRIV